MLLVILVAIFFPQLANGQDDFNLTGIMYGTIQECDPSLLLGVWYGSCSSSTGIDREMSVCSDRPCQQPYR